jgi:hypothetical protein
LVLHPSLYTRRSNKSKRRDGGRVMKLFPGLTFSWKRALGITAAKRKISKSTGIPLTRQGRRAKLGKWMGMR